MEKEFESFWREEKWFHRMEKYYGEMAGKLEFVYCSQSRKNPTVLYISFSQNELLITCVSLEGFLIPRP